MGKAVESALDELRDDIGVDGESVEVESIEIDESMPKTQAEVMAIDKEKLSTFSPDQRKQLAQFYTSQIKVSLFQTALSLVAIKTLELYKDLGYEKFTSYVEEECGMSTRYANELTLAVEEYGSGDRIKELMESSPKRFLKAVRETRAKQLEGEKLMLSDGTEVSAEDYIKERIEQLESSSSKRIKELERDLKNTKAIADYAEGEKDKLKKTIDDKNKKIDALAKSKQLDPDRIQKIAEQREVEKVIDEQTQAITKAIKNLTEIPPEMRNSSLGLYLTRCIATLKVTVKHLEMDWGSHIVAGEME